MKIGCASLKLSHLSILKAVTDCEPEYIGWDKFFAKRASVCEMFVGWGYSPYSQKAKKAAEKYEKPFIYAEDGFLRSPFVSSISKQPYSLVIDTQAPYYDYSKRTDLEALICQTELNQEQYQEAQKVIDYFTQHRLGKFSITSDTDIDPEGFTEGSILLIDQVAGDLSLQYGGVTERTAQYTVNTIREKYPNQKIYLKLHPEVFAGKKKGCFDFIHNDPDVVCIPKGELSYLLTKKPHVHVLTSLAGFEACLHGCQTTTYGMPWYAAYGITEDLHPDIKQLQQRRKVTDLQTLFYCAYMQYTHYIDPISQKTLDIMTIMQFFARIKRHINLLSGNVIALGIRPWKKKDFLNWIETPFNKIDTVTDDSSFKEVSKRINSLGQEKTKIIVWGYKYSELIQEIQQAYPKIQIIRVEDGFIRSYGLGSDFFPPLSLSFDTGHLYYVHTEQGKSDFFGLLNQEPHIKRVHALRNKIQEHHITKYNIETLEELDIKTSKKIIFVPGQVAGDASLMHGGLPAHLKTDYDLLKQVRQDYPDSYILYKPHPDVYLGGRQEGEKDHQCSEFYDQIITDVSIISCIKAADKIITLTSQAGFDALIHGKSVHCYGHPFYKAFTDNNNVEQLIHTALIEYPIYKDEKTYLMPENAIDKIMYQKSLVENPFRYLIIRFKLLKLLYKAWKWVR